MTAKDRWLVNLTCPQCGETGIAELWQEDGWSFANGDQSTHIESVSPGFSAGHGKKNWQVEFRCVKCNIAPIRK